MAGWIELIVFSVLLGVLFGVFVHFNQVKGKQSATAKTPIVGPMLAYEFWWPHSAHDKNILVGKVVVFGYMLLVMYHYIFIFFAIIPVLFHLEWFDEND
jgi:hypothetical protein